MVIKAANKRVEYDAKSVARLTQIVRQYKND